MSTANISETLCETAFAKVYEKVFETDFVNVNASETDNLISAQNARIAHEKKQLEMLPWLIKSIDKEIKKAIDKVELYAIYEISPHYGNMITVEKTETLIYLEHCIDASCLYYVYCYHDLSNIFCSVETSQLLLKAIKVLEEKGYNVVYQKSKRLIIWFKETKPQTVLTACELVSTVPETSEPKHL